jgi:hypothetical protein
VVFNRRLARVRARLLAAVGCVGSLAVGCTPAIPVAGNQFDGTYQGDNQVVRGFGWVCAPPSYQDAVTVRGGRFNYTFVDQLAQPALIPVQIAADGTFRGQFQYGTESTSRWVGFIVVWATVTGRINGAALEATAGDFRCTRQLMLTEPLSSTAGLLRGVPMT